MTARLLFVPVWQVFDSAGAPIAGAKAYFYGTGTLIAATVYQDAALTTPHAQPVVADASGRFAPVFYADTTSLRVQLKDASGTLIKDVDPLNPAATSIQTADLANNAVTAAKAATTLVQDLLGGDPLLKSGGTMTGEARLGDPSVISSDSAGYRGTNFNTQDTAYTIAYKDQGKGLRHTSSTAHDWTISPDGTGGGQVNWSDAKIELVNLGTGVVSVKRGAGVTLWKAGGVTSADAALAQGAVATLRRVSTNQWTITGVGIS